MERSAKSANKVHFFFLSRFQKDKLFAIQCLSHKPFKGPSETIQFFVYTMNSYWEEKKIVELKSESKRNAIPVCSTQWREEESAKKFFFCNIDVLCLFVWKESCLSILPFVNRTHCISYKFFIILINRMEVCAVIIIVSMNRKAINQYFFFVRFMYSRCAIKRLKPKILFLSIFGYKRLKKKEKTLPTIHSNWYNISLRYLLICFLFLYRLVGSEIWLSSRHNKILPILRVQTGKYFAVCDGLSKRMKPEFCFFLLLLHIPFELEGF